MWRHLSGTLAVQFPQAIQPLIETNMDYDCYSGRKLVPYFQDKREPIVDDATTSSALSVAASRELSSIGIQYHPKKIDHLIRGYLGTVGSYGLLASDGIMRNYLGLPVGAEKRADQHPVLSRFLQERVGTGPVEGFYQLANEVDVFTKTLAELDKQGRTEEWTARAEKNKGLLGIEEDVAEISKEMGELRKFRREVDRDPTMSATRKKETKILIQEEMNRIVSYLGKRKAEYMKRTD